MSAIKIRLQLTGTDNVNVGFSIFFGLSMLMGRIVGVCASLLFFDDAGIFSSCIVYADSLLDVMSNIWHCPSAFMHTIKFFDIIYQYQLSIEIANNSNINTSLNVPFLNS